MNNVKWVLNSRMFENTSYQNLPELIQDLGMECKVIDYIYSSYDNLYKELFPINDCVIPYVTINSARKLNKYFGLYLNENNLQYHVYSSMLGLDPDIFLNDDFRMITFFNFKIKWWQYYTEFNTDTLFIRPTSGIKLFTGTPLKRDNCEREIEIWETILNDDTIILIADIKQFSDEARFVICGDQIVDGSLYSTDNGNIKKEQKEYPKELLSVVEKVAKATWKPDEIFTVDACITPYGPKIVEINSFSCAGWYACNAEKIVKAVSEKTLQFYNEQYS